MSSMYGLAVVHGEKWAFFIVAWWGSIWIFAFLYLAYKFRHCKARFWFLLVQGLLLLLLLAFGGALLLLPWAYWTDAMQWVLTSIGIALPVSGIVGARLLRRFEVNHPEEAERCRRVEQELLH
jgi:hypothetical protein